MKKLLILLLTFLILVGLVACKKDDKVFTSHIPPETAEVGEDIQIDETNHIKITEVKAVTVEETDVKSANVVRIFYDWTNNSKSASTSDKNFTITAKQNGVSLKPNLEDVDKVKLVTQLDAGDTLSGIGQGFELQDKTSPVTFSIKGKMHTVFIDGKPKGAYPIQVTVEITN